MVGLFCTILAPCGGGLAEYIPMHGEAHSWKVTDGITTEPMTLDGTWGVLAIE